MSTFKLEAEVDGPVFFLHKSGAKGADVSNIEIKEYYKTPEEIAKWEKQMFDDVGLKIDGNALIAAGGSCCGTGGGACDAD
ncbi:hypothetical protein [Pseudomonas lini]|uniref:hypothetical protein n=1 Tax=Pseudomonas lini TaxID=163011 RepID=UPI00345E5A96